MSSSNEKKSKLESTKSTGKITKAMEMVSASKLNKARKDSLGNIEYLETLKSFIADSVKGVSEVEAPLLKLNLESKKTLIILVGVQRGLVGSLVSKLEVALSKLVAEIQKEDGKFDVVTLKKRTINIALKIGIKPALHFEESFEQNALNDIEGVKRMIVDRYLSGEYKNVVVLYPKFISAFAQEAEVAKLLPFEKDKLDENRKETFEFKFEPEKEEILTEMLELYLESFIYSILNNSAASEYAARMVSMKKASDNARDIEKKLLLELNKERQMQITNQLQENFRKVNNQQ